MRLRREPSKPDNPARHAHMRDWHHHRGRGLFDMQHPPRVDHHADMHHPSAATHRAHQNHVKLLRRGDRLPTIILADLHRAGNPRQIACADLAIGRKIGPQTVGIDKADPRVCGAR